jgi:CBS-domain-containing membrane protein
MFMDLKARDIMNETVIACLPETRVEEVVRTLAEHSISGMPVIDVHEKVIGIVSESDLLLADEMEPKRVKTALFGFYILRESVMDRLAELRGVQVQDVMTRDVVTFGPEDSVHDIAKVLHDKRINRVPIVDEENKLLGILSRADIIRALAGQMSQQE